MTAILLGISTGCVDEAKAPKNQATPKPQQVRFGGSEKDMFDEVARSLVGAYEALGRLEGFYDTLGDCGEPELEDCYVWRFRSENPTVKAVLTRFSPRPGGRAAGDYEGFIHFMDRKRQLKRIDVKLRYEGEELEARLATRDLPASGTNS